MASPIKRAKARKPKAKRKRAATAKRTATAPGTKVWKRGQPVFSTKASRAKLLKAHREAQKRGESGIALRLAAEHDTSVATIRRNVRRAKSER